jgi:hypothetical protein
MPAEIVNLRSFRKAKARAEKVEAAAENRRRFGRSKAEQAEEAAERERAEKLIDGHRRDTGDD